MLVGGKGKSILFGLSYYKDHFNALHGCENKQKLINFKNHWPACASRHFEIIQRLPFTVSSRQHFETVTHTSTTREKKEAVKPAVTHTSTTAEKKEDVKHAATTVTHTSTTAE